MPEPDGVSRRDFLRMVAVGGAGGLVLVSCGDAGTITTAGRSTAAPTTAATTTTGAPPPLMRVRHGSIAPTFEPYLARFNELYAPLRAEMQTVPSDYFSVTETAFLAGDVDFHVLFADTGFPERWYNAGWIRPIDGLIDNIDELKADMVPAAFSDLHARDGSLIALPYFVGTEHFFYNTEMLDAIGVGPPETWEELIQTSRDLKAAGVVDFPFGPFWSQQYDIIWFTFAAAAFSNGAGPFFDENSVAVFDSDPATIGMVEIWRQMYEEELVPPDILAIDYGATGGLFGGGLTAFTIRYQLEAKPWSDPEASAIAGKFSNAMMPGSAHTTGLFTSYWVMSSSVEDPAAAGKLLSFMGGQDLEGDYYVTKNAVGLDLGLPPAYSQLFDDPDIRTAWGEYLDVGVAAAQHANAMSHGTAPAEEWFAEFTGLISVELQKAIRGDVSAEEALKTAAEFARSRV